MEIIETKKAFKKINKRIEEDREGNYFYREFDNRQKEIQKETYGCAIEKRYRDNEEIVQVTRVERMLERFMEKTQDTLKRMFRAQEKIWGEFDTRLRNIERRFGIEAPEYTIEEERRISWKVREGRNGKNRKIEEEDRRYYRRGAVQEKIGTMTTIMTIKILNWNA